MKIRIIKKKNLDEISAVGAGVVTGAPREDLEEQKVIEEATHVESGVTEDNDYEYNSFISVFNTDLNYKIIQALVIEEGKIPIRMGSYQDLSHEIQKCMPNAIIDNYGVKYLKNSEIYFEIEHMEKDGKPITDFWRLGENIFLNKMDSLKFFKQVMKEIGQYISKHLDKVYHFTGVPSDNRDERGSGEATKRTEIYKMGLKRLFRSLPGNWQMETVGSPNNLFFWRCPDGEQANLVFENKEIEFTNEEIDLIHEMYSTSGAVMGSGSGQIPKERNPKAHKRYVRIRFTRQGLQNFKPNRYFPDKDQ